MKIGQLIKKKKVLYLWFRVLIISLVVNYLLNIQLLWLVLIVYDLCLRIFFSRVNFSVVGKCKGYEKVCWLDVYCIYSSNI